MIDDKLIKEAEYFYRENMKNEKASMHFRSWYQDSADHRHAYAHVYMVRSEGIEFPSLQNPAVNDWGSVFTFKVMYSAVVLLGFLIITIFYINDLISQKPLYTRIVSERGLIKDVTLSDGTQITLAPDSSIQVADFMNGNRNIILEAGEAFLNVAHDRERPFRITSKDTLVEVLGTSFNVNKVNDEYFTLSLLEGKVLIKQRISEGLMDAFDQYDQITLKPAEKIVIKNGAFLLPEKVNIDQMASWRQGKFNYFNEPLSVVISDINRYSDIPYQIEDNNLKELPVTAIFSTDQIRTMISGLEKILPITVTYNDNGAHVIRNSKDNNT